MRERAQERTDRNQGGDCGARMADIGAFLLGGF